MCAHFWLSKKDINTHVEQFTKRKANVTAPYDFVVDHCIEAFGTEDNVKNPEASQLHDSSIRHSCGEQRIPCSTLTVAPVNEQAADVDWELGCSRRHETGRSWYGDLMLHVRT
ncbi:unnamed protein product [Zymoseptoria tritici ST99CH_3D7]|uniref:Uncharacterized protein n=1 Tax=Zymoseptoria tritici (strain ST99CH_3D7) TaxID=1276538 RepID=A0A1X7S9M9_ZYMT9|nr:unnamed protein product [Zymoseptoria tritici ST99CH_3D7]